MAWHHHTQSDACRVSATDLDFRIGLAIALDDAGPADVSVCLRLVAATTAGTSAAVLAHHSPCRALNCFTIQIVLSDNKAQNPEM